MSLKLLRYLCTGLAALLKTIISVLHFAFQYFHEKSKRNIFWWPKLVFVRKDNTYGIISAYEL